MDPDFQENVGCPWPLGYRGHQNSALILTKELWYNEGRGLCFHSEVKNERASFYGTFGMTGIGGLSPLHPALPRHHPGPSSPAQGMLLC